MTREGKCWERWAGVGCVDEGISRGKKHHLRGNVEEQWDEELWGEVLGGEAMTGNVNK